MNIVSEYIAPWALAGEHIPFHFLWMPEPDLNNISVELPPKFSVVEVLNVGKYSSEQEGRRIVIDCGSLKSNNYFGMVVRSMRKYRKTLVQFPINVSFISHDRVLAKRILKATVVRPKLKVVEAPEKLIIDDDVNPKKLFNLSVAHFGLGTAQINMRVTARAKTVSKTDSLYLMILQELCEEILEPKKHEEVEPVSRGFRLDERWLQATTQEIASRIMKGNIPLEMKEEVTEKVLELLADEKDRERILRAIYTRLRRLLLGALLYYIDRYPEEDIDLPYGRISTIFRSEVERLKIRFNYKDSIGNRYSPIQITIDVDDRRTNKEKIFQAPINVNWKRGR